MSVFKPSQISLSQQLRSSFPYFFLVFVLHSQFYIIFRLSFSSLQRLLYIILLLRRFSNTSAPLYAAFPPTHSSIITVPRFYINNNVIPLQLHLTPSPAPYIDLWVEGFLNVFIQVLIIIPCLYMMVISLYICELPPSPLLSASCCIVEAAERNATLDSVLSSAVWKLFISVSVMFSSPRLYRPFRTYWNTVSHNVFMRGCCTS